jgi:phosphoribosylglycinamide formyltransferase-1
VKVAVLVSGSGTNLQALLDAEAAGRLAPAEIAVVVSNNPGAAAHERARAAGRPALVVDHRGHGSREAFETALLAALAPYGAEVIVLAGFMRLLTPTFLGGFAGRVVNTHPSILPAFPGHDAAAQAIAHGVKLSGCTVHFVDAGVDTGPIIAQRAVPVLAGDDAAALQKRIQAEEHRLLPVVVRALAAGRVSCEGRRVVIAPVGGEGAEADADQLV